MHYVKRMFDNNRVQMSSAFDVVKLFCMYGRRGGGAPGAKWVRRLVMSRQSSYTISKRFANIMVHSWYDRTPVDEVNVDLFLQGID